MAEPTATHQTDQAPHSEATAESASVAHGSQGDGHGQEDGHGAPEVPSGLDWLATFPFAKEKHGFDLSLRGRSGEVVQYSVRVSLAEAIHNYQNQFYALVMVAVVAAVLARRLRRASLRAPGRFQATVEMIVTAFRDLVYGVLGERNGQRYLPYIGSLFVFILLCNLMGLIPFLRSPTSVYQTTFALALCTFAYVQFSAVRHNGLIRYLYRLAGEPRGEGIGMTIFMWTLGLILLLPLHILGELIKPVSLSLRLFGNILGEDILLGVFAILGLSVMKIVGWEQPWVGFPLQLPFFFLALLTSTVQALVFSLLSMVYFLMVLPHEQESH